MTGYCRFDIKRYKIAQNTKAYQIADDLTLKHDLKNVITKLYCIAHHGHDTADTEGAHDDVPLVLLHPDGIHFQ